MTTSAQNTGDQRDDLRQLEAADPSVMPAILMPQPEADWLRQTYAGARVILEYGSGGSTAFAAGLPDKTIFTVESDAKWLGQLGMKIAMGDVASEPILHHVDIGPTKAWGYPDGDKAWRRFHHYGLSIWDHPEFVQPDVVLIDGRFRLGCALAVLARTKAPLRMLWDDYTERAAYHAFEDFAKPVETRGRMAGFDIVPQAIDPARFIDVITYMQREL